MFGVCCAIVLGPGEQYVRGSSGIASWKIICKQEPREEEQGVGSKGMVGGAATEGSECGAASDAAERLREVEVAGESESCGHSGEAGQDVGVADDRVGGVTGVGGDEARPEGEGNDMGGGGGGGGGGGEELDHRSSPAVLEVTSEEVMNLGELAGAGEEAV